MNRHCLFTNIFIMLSLLCCSSCKGQVKTNFPEDSSGKPTTITDKGLGLPKTTDEMKSFLDKGVDPYFTDTKDTFSVHGPQCIVRNLIQDKAGNIWLATWQGIIKYDGKVFTNYTLKEQLIRFHVISLFEDSQRNIWFGSARGGVYRYDGNSFILFTKKEGLPDNTVYSIAEDKNKNIWFGTENGISRYDGIAFSNFTTRDGLCDNFINAILKDKTGRMWFGTNNGINYYDGKTFTKFSGADGTPFKQVVSLLEDKEGNLWIGSGAEQSGGKGLCRYDGKSVINAVTPYFVMYMCEDKKGNLWLAHNKGAENVNFALYKYDKHLTGRGGKQAGNFIKITEQHEPDNPVIFGIMEDKKGNIWFGTAKGVCRCDGKTTSCFTE